MALGKQPLYRVPDKKYSTKSGTLGKEAVSSSECSWQLYFLLLLSGEMSRTGLYISMFTILSSKNSTSDLCLTLHEPHVMQYLVFVCSEHFVFYHFNRNFGRLVETAIQPLLQLGLGLVVPLWGMQERKYIENFFLMCFKQRALVLLGCLKIPMLLRAARPMKHFYAGFLQTHFRNMVFAGQKMLFGTKFLFMFHLPL